MYPAAMKSSFVQGLMSQQILLQVSPLPNTFIWNKQSSTGQREEEARSHEVEINNIILKAECPCSG